MSKMMRMMRVIGLLGLMSSVAFSMSMHKIIQSRIFHAVSEYYIFLVQ